MNAHDTNRVASTSPPIARGWWVAFMVFGSLVALDGVWGLVAGGLGAASIVESIGQLIAGPWLVAHGVLGRRDGRGLRGTRIHLVLAVGMCLYLSGILAGRVDWAAILG